MRVVLLLQAVCLVGLAPAIGASQAAAPLQPDLSARTVRAVGDTIEFDLPAGYRRRNPYTDCYHRLETSPYTWRDLCVEKLSSPLSPRGYYRSDSTALEARCADCAFYEQIRLDTLARQPHLIVRQRALLTGTLDHYQRHAVWMLHIWLAPELIVVFAGDGHGEEAAEQELLAIARTVRLRRP